MLFIRKPIEVTNQTSARWLTIKRDTPWVLKSDTSMGTSAAMLIREFRRTSRIPAAEAPHWRVKGQRPKEDSTARRRRPFTENTVETWLMTNAICKGGRFKARITETSEYDRAIIQCE